MQFARNNPGRRALGMRVVLVLCCTGWGGSVLWASAPLSPIQIPFFSFDRESPTPPSSGYDVRADSVLMLNTSSVIPATRYPGGNYGLGRDFDDVDGFSFNRSVGGPPPQFLLLFSVDRATRGDVPPDQALVDAEVPFNVADQATRGHAAGDGYLTLALFNTNGIIPSTISLRDPTMSNVQSVNNYDEGGNDFQAAPPVSSKDYTYALRVPQDNVDGIAYDTSGPGSASPVLYFTVDPQSPSLDGFLPGDSPATIFFDFDPANPGPVAVYAPALALGLSPLDDIDALVVFDTDTNGLFSMGDLVLFSLAPESPSLQPGIIPGISPNGAADVIGAEILPGGILSLRVFGPANSLGLIDANDNITALELVPCADATICAEQAGIRLVQGDWTNDGQVKADDVPSFVACLSGPYEGMGSINIDPVCLDVYDFDHDQDVDLIDFARFVHVFGLMNATP